MFFDAHLRSTAVSARVVADLRFFGLEHAVYMILAVILAHIGSALSKKAADSRGKFVRAAIFYGLALLLVLLGIPWGRPLIPGMG